MAAGITGISERLAALQQQSHLFMIIETIASQCKAPVKPKVKTDASKPETKVEVEKKVHVVSTNNICHIKKVSI